MCFTPTISITTAIIEFVVATFILFYFKRSLVTKFFAAVIYLLGFYQFTEFMLCTSNSPILWAKLGFMTYTFLPAIGLHFALKLNSYKKNLGLIYLIPILFNLIALFKEDFISGSSCSSFFIIISYSFFNSYNILQSIISKFYLLYYFGFIAMALYFFFKKYQKTKSKRRKFALIVLIFIIVITIALPVILVLILPSLKIMFPSIYCEFAILFTITAVYTSYVYSKS